MALIIPAILEDNLEGFEDKLSAVLKVPGVTRVQVDFSDGIFTARKTLEVSDLDVLSPAYFWEAHLMLQHPAKHFLDAKIAGFNGVVVHYEALRDELAQQRGVSTGSGNDDSDYFAKVANEIRKLKMSPGLGISPETPVQQIFKYVQFFDQILILSVQPGYQGQQFLEETYQRISALRKHWPQVKIEVDGAVKESNVKELVRCGADMLVVGSAIFDNSEANPSQGRAEIASQNYEKLVAQASI